MDQDVGAEALIISLVHEGILSTSIVSHRINNNVSSHFKSIIIHFASGVAIRTE